MKAGKQLSPPPRHGFLPNPKDESAVAEAERTKHPHDLSGAIAHREECDFLWVSVNAMGDAEAAPEPWEETAALEALHLRRNKAKTTQGTGQFQTKGTGNKRCLGTKAGSGDSGHSHMAVPMFNFVSRRSMLRRGRELRGRFHNNQFAWNARNPEKASRNSRAAIRTPVASRWRPDHLTTSPGGIDSRGPFRNEGIRGKNLLKRFLRWRYGKPIAGGIIIDEIVAEARVGIL